MVIVIFGGLGFVGSSIARVLAKEHEVTVVDNLSRRGAERNLSGFSGVSFIHADIRNFEDFWCLPVNADLVVDCSAEPSANAGMSGDHRKIIAINYLGTLNILEYCRTISSKLIFLSTSRVYSYKKINETLHLSNGKLLPCRQDWQKGVDEKFDTSGLKTLYGHTKYSSEGLIKELAPHFGIEFIVNRAGLIYGPGQWGRSDQGVIPFWIASRLLKRPLFFRGFGGNGTQVRDSLYITDFCQLIEMQISEFEKCKNRTFNVGGGLFSHFAIRELDHLVTEILDLTNVRIQRQTESFVGDVGWYVTDHTKASQILGWNPIIDLPSGISMTADFVKENLDAF